MNKTGTSTMKHCFEVLGIGPIASPKTLTPDIRRLLRQFYRDRNYTPILQLAERYQAFEDRPWNMWEMYRYLDTRFPDSRFILTVRDPESWWRSTERWVTVSKPKVLSLYQLHLRVPDTSKDAMIESYLRYNREVVEYFRGTGKLLEMNLEKGDEWATLCDFLGYPVPLVSFPHANRQSYGPEDAIMLERQRQLKNGVECQSCSHITAPSSRAVGRIIPGGKHAERGPASLVRATARKLKARVLRRSKSQAYRMLQLVSYQLHKARQALTRGPKAAALHQIPEACNSVAIDGFAVVSCLFNPSGSQKRVENFKRFLSGIRATGVRCVAVELAFGSNPFQLGDYDDVIALRTNHVMWHKERLLNIGISKLLEEGYEKIAWLDGDISFDDPAWPHIVANKLETAKLCQVFGTVAITGDAGSVPEVGPSAVKYFVEHGRLYSQPPSTLRGLLQGRLRGGQSGFGWAARAEVLREVMLYENAIVGGGDKLMCVASLAPDGQDRMFEALTVSTIECEQCGHRNSSAAYNTNFQQWAARWAAAVENSVDYADLHIQDMYHGKRNDRKYLVRRDILFRHQFDPASDVVLDASGCLSWATGKQKLHHDVESYFLSRREDV